MPPPVIAVAPLVAVPTTVTERISPVSGAMVSLARTSIALAPESSSTVGVSVTAVGGSLTAVTVIVNVWVSLVLSSPLAVPPLSVR